MEEEGDIDVTDAEDLLRKARLALDKEEPMKAKDLSEKAERIAKDKMALYQSATSAIGFAERTIRKAQDSKLDVTDARNFLTKSRHALRNGEFHDSIALAERAVAATMVDPKPGKELTVKTVFAHFEDRILYKVLIKNNTGEVFNRLNIIPDTSNSIFVPMPENTLINLKPYGEEKILFELRPISDAAYTGENFIIGRDATLSTVLVDREEGLVFRVKVRNETERPLETLHVEPFVPEGYFATPSDAYVNLPPYASRTLDFNLKSTKKKKVELEVDCPYCHGTFIVEQGVKAAVCPWCHNEVDVKAATSAGKEEGGKKPSPKKRKRKTKHTKRNKPQRRKPAGAGACPVCGGKGRVMVRSSKGKMKEQICPRCKGVGKA